MWLCWSWPQDHNSWFMSEQCHGLWFWEVLEYTEKPSETSCQPTDVLRDFSCSCVNSSGFLFQRGHFPLLPYPLLSILDKIEALALALGIYWSQQPVLLFVTDNRDSVYCFNIESLQIICRWAWGIQTFGMLECSELSSLPNYPLTYPWLDLY